MLEVVKIELVLKENWHEPWRRRRKKSRVYFWVDQENIVENLLFRTARPHQLYRKVLPSVVKKVFVEKEARVLFSQEHLYEGNWEWIVPMFKASWSQYAGCSCPCSPGFITEGTTNFPFDISVTVKASTEAKVNPEAPVPVDRIASLAADKTLGPISESFQKMMDSLIGG